MSQISTVAVTGATGFVGRRVVAELVRRGYQVRALVRDADKAAGVLPPDKAVRTVVGDVLDRSSPQRLLEDVQAVVHLVGIIREVRQPGRPPQTFQRMHIDAASAMVDAATAAGVRRFVHMSAIGVAPDAKAEYATSKYEGEQVLRRSGLDWTIFRPSLIHGPDAEALVMMRSLAAGAQPPWFVVPYFTRFTDHPEEGVFFPRLTLDPAMLQPVHVDDVAAVFAEALSRPQTVHEIYNVVGSERLDWRQFMEACRDELPGADPSLTLVPVPSEHAAIMAKAARAFGMGGLLPFDEGQAWMAGRDADGDLYKLVAHLGVQPRPFRESLRAYAGQMAPMR